MKIKNIIFCLLGLMLCVNALAQNVTGMVRDAESGEVLVGAVVYWDKTTVGATCNVLITVVEYWSLSVISRLY